MKLIQFTDLHNGDAVVFVNPDQVVCVQRVTGETWITTTAQRHDGAAKIIAVKEDLETVTNRLT